MSEIIFVRKLTKSDLGWLAAHQGTAPSKQRAINVNAWIAQALLDREAWSSGRVDLPCRCIYNHAKNFETRSLAKIGKNWRLGGSKLEGQSLAAITNGDFVVFKSPEGNNGSRLVLFTFVSQAHETREHYKVDALVRAHLTDSMAAFVTGQPDFHELNASLFPAAAKPKVEPRVRDRIRLRPATPIPPIPTDEDEPKHKPRTLRDRLRSPHILSHMLRVSSELSAEAQYEFMTALERLAEQLRAVLLAAGLIHRVDRDHASLWREVKGNKIAFVDGGMGNIGMIGSAPISARVGGYIVSPGVLTDDREQFSMVKHLIDELYAPVQGRGVYAGLFPDTGPLRDAARISVEAAGAVQLLEQNPEIRFLFLHGALVNPVARYTDLMDGGQVVAPFPNFSASALQVLLPNNEAGRAGKDANFVRVYRRQIEFLQESNAMVCGVVERESQADSVFRRMISLAIDHPAVPPLLPRSPDDWAHWFAEMMTQFRISDSLLFRCVLQPGEVTSPVDIDRNDLRRAPSAWAADIQQYPRPWVSYMQPTEWVAPMRVEVFPRDRDRMPELSRLLMHCAWLLPRYAFPVGLDIVDKYAKVPNWMTKPITTNTAVKALRQAMDSGDTKTFDAMRRLLCGSTRDWLFRPRAT